MPPSLVARLLGSNGFRQLALALLTLPFWLSGLTKLADIPGALAEANQFGLQPAPLAVGVTVLVQLVGSALVVTRRWAWLGTAALAFFTLAATLIAHPFWAFADSSERLQQARIFVEHLGLIGGLLLANPPWPPPPRAPQHGEVH